jgi:DNA-binding NtrC family response regulator
MLLQSDMTKDKEPDPSADSVALNTDLSVLIVDDEEDVRIILSEYVRELSHYNVFTASDAKEGLAIIDSENIDCIFSDINMPGMDGIEFISEVKKRDITISATVITGQPSMDKILQAMRAGATDFLSKPFKLMQFQVALERMVKERRLLRENIYLAE